MTKQIFPKFESSFKEESTFIDRFLKLDQSNNQGVSAEEFADIDYLKESHYSVLEADWTALSIEELPQVVKEMDELFGEDDPSYQSTRILAPSSRHHFKSWEANIFLRMEASAKILDKRRLSQIWKIAQRKNDSKETVLLCKCELQLLGMRNLPAHRLIQTCLSQWAADGAFDKIANLTRRLNDPIEITERQRISFFMYLYWDKYFAMRPWRKIYQLMRQLKFFPSDWSEEQFTKHLKRMGLKKAQ